jgi:hypothetical protein
MRLVLKLSWALALAAICGPASAGRQESPPPPPTVSVDPALSAAVDHSATAAKSFDEVVDRIIAQEKRFLDLMRNLHPLAETYIQNLKNDPELGSVPESDEYFLGRLNLSARTPSDDLYRKRDSRTHHLWDKVHRVSHTYLPVGFAQSIVIDQNHFDRQLYSFQFVRWEQLGAVHCVVADVIPLHSSGGSGFTGRIWAEDQDFNIVRIRGAYASASPRGRSFHFDSWRLNLLPTVWLPAYIYTEESDLRNEFGHTIRFKAQTRFWGYDLQHAGDHREYAKPLLDYPVATSKHAEASQDLSPVLTRQRPEYSAEENVVERLQVAGLMAPAGDVDQVLHTVVNNLIVTNELDISVPGRVAGIRCRVLLTTPLESFVVGRTIVLSRGLLDVLPDEATLAAILAHELGHIVLGHSVGLEYGATDRLLFTDDMTFQQVNFRFDAEQEAAADNKGMELLAKSPYKDKLASAGLFLRTLQARASQLPHLIQPRLGNGLAERDTVRMQALVKSAPELQMTRTDQVGALPLGGRIRVDPWSDRIELVKVKPVALMFAGEKMPFEVTPFYPRLERISGQERTSQAPGGN